MGYVPKDVKWFLADLVVAIAVEGTPELIVHVNTVLVRANSATVAYRRALALGRRERLQYRNASGQQVTCRFLGLAELNVVHDDL
jgi:Domain of unknown function (DUF4288)